MTKPWIGYLSSALLLAAGAVYLIGGRTGLGVLFIVVAAASAFLNIYIARRKNR